MEVIAAIDMCVVPTLTFERLFAFLVLSHGRRQLLWFEVTRRPTAEWLARQITEAFPWTSAEQSNGLVPSLLCRSWVDCIIATRGYDFRKGQPYQLMTHRSQGRLIGAADKS
jgi:hypothetical protein